MLHRATQIAIFSTLIFFVALAKAQLLRFQEVGPGVYRSSQPESAEDYAKLKALGIQKIIDLRLDNSVEPARQRAKLWGIEQIDLPLNTNSGNEDYLGVWEKAQSLLKSAKEHPVLFHCRLGKDRTGLISALFRVYEQGVSPEVAYKEWRAMGLSDDWGTGIQDFFWKYTKTHPPILSCNSMLLQ